jgi:hypothetical protein
VIQIKDFVAVSRRIYQARRVAVTRSVTETYFVTTRPGPNTGPCDDCGSDVAWAHFDHLVGISRFTFRELFRMTETGRLHFQETTEGNLLICTNSFAFAEKSIKE